LNKKLAKDSIKDKTFSMEFLIKYFR